MTWSRAPRFYEWRGHTYTLTELADYAGLSRELVYRRLSIGWTIDQALAAPVGSGNRNRRGETFEHDGQLLTAAEWAGKIGIPYQTLRSRLRLGWTIERALSTPALRPAA